jgi:hypothetical protein
MYGPSDGTVLFGIIFFFIGLTFGVWKIVELIIWIVKHVSISWG